MQYCSHHTPNQTERELRPAEREAVPVSDCDSKDQLACEHCAMPDPPGSADDAAPRWLTLPHLATFFALRQRLAKAPAAAREFWHSLSCNESAAKDCVPFAR